MNISESFSISFVNLKSNKVRAFLSMLGIIIGIAAVIIVVAITNGAKEEVLQSIGTEDSFIYVVNAKYNEKTNRRQSGVLRNGRADKAQRTACPYPRRPG